MRHLIDPGEPSTTVRRGPRSWIPRLARRRARPLLEMPLVWSLAFVAGAFVAHHLLNPAIAPAEVRAIDRAYCERVLATAAAQPVDAAKTSTIAGSTWR